MQSLTTVVNCGILLVLCHTVLVVYGMMPEMTREGGSIPITLTFEELLGPGKSVMLLPMGQSDDGAHSQNEKLSLRNYIYGVRVTMLYSTSALPKNTC